MIILEKQSPLYIIYKDGQCCRKYDFRSNGCKLSIDVDKNSVPIALKIIHYEQQCATATGNDCKIAKANLFVLAKEILACHDPRDNHIAELLDDVVDNAKLLVCA